MKNIALALVATVGVSAAAIAAPNPNAAPISGEISLTANFQPDPRVIRVRAGGTNNARTIADSCAGFISDAPDVRLNYASGQGLPLIISVAADADTTLVVNGPDGQWYCNDDGGRIGSNPAVRLNNPGSGRYEIWVGTYSSGSTEAAALHISEASSQ